MMQHLSTVRGQQHCNAAAAAAGDDDDDDDDIVVSAQWFEGVDFCVHRQCESGAASGSTYVGGEQDT